MAKIKICGITNPEDHRVAVDLGADYCGFIFYPESPRYINPIKARQIIAQNTGKDHKNVGIFVNEPLAEIRKTVAFCNLDIVQLHGDEPPLFCLKIDIPCWKAFRLKDEAGMELLGRYPCRTFLLDAYNPDLYGGTGKTLNTKLAELVIQQGYRTILAGGISSDNVANYLKLFPYGLDICSSVEEKPGKKDHGKMAALIHKITSLKGNSGENNG